MSKISTWFGNVSGMWKAVVLIVAIFSAGLTTGAIAGGFTKIPSRVATLEETAISLQGQISDMHRDVAELRKINNIQLCLQLAEKSHTDWRACINDR